MDVKMYHLSYLTINIYTFYPRVVNNTNLMFSSEERAFLSKPLKYSLHSNILHNLCIVRFQQHTLLRQCTIIRDMYVCVYLYIYIYCLNRAFCRYQINIFYIFSERTGLGVETSKK
jgi:hypothetical protein